MSRHRTSNTQPDIAEKSQKNIKGRKEEQMSQQKREIHVKSYFVRYANSPLTL